MILPIALLVAACGGDTAASTSTSEDVGQTSTTSASTTTTASSTTTTSAETTTTALRGEPVEGGPPRGAILAVVGVAFDDVLNLRANPGADQVILDGIPPTYGDVLALGSTRSLPAWWVEVAYEDTIGWVNLSYLAYEGETTDTTANILDELGGSLEAPTMTELGARVADTIASDDPPSDIVVVVEESVGDLGEVTYDVIGLGDDSVRGVRIHVFGEATADGFSLGSVESTLLCDPDRGVDDDGSCV